MVTTDITLITAINVGMRIYTLDGNPLIYNKPSLINPAFIVGSYSLINLYIHG